MAKVLVNTAKMDKDTWLDIKNKYVSATDATVILGFNKFKSKMQLFLEKTEQIEKQYTNSDAAYFGTILESVVADEFTRRTGIKVRNKNAILQHETEEWVIGNVDRLVVGEKCGLECKTTSAYNAKEWEEEEIPPAYIIQCQYYMYLTGYSSWWIACLIGGQKFVYKKIERDEELINMIVESCREFWFEHVLKNIPPAIDGTSASSEFLSRLYPNSNGAQIELDEQADELIKIALETKDEIKRLEEQQKEAENKLKMLMGENEIAATQNGNKITWKTVVSSRLDSKLLKADHPEIYKQYAKDSVSRRFTIKG